MLKLISTLLGTPILLELPEHMEQSQEEVQSKQLLELREEYRRNDCTVLE